MGIFDKIKDYIDKGIDAITDVTKGVISFVGDAFNFVLSPFEALTPDMSIDNSLSSDPSNLAEGVKITKSGTNVAIPVVYGLRRVGGTVVHVETNGEDNKYLYAVYAIAEGPIAAVRKIFIDEREMEDFQANQPSVAGDAKVFTCGKGLYKDLVKYEIFNGYSNASTASPRQVQSTLMQESPSWGLKNRPGEYLAYAVFRFEMNRQSENNPFSGGIPSIQFEINGRLVEDLRDEVNVVAPDNTPGKIYPADFILQNNYDEDAGDYTTKVLGDDDSMYAGINPANCLLDYLRSTRYGCGIPNEKIDVDSFKIAAEKFDQNIDYSSTQRGKAMTMNAVIDPLQPVIDNLKILVNGCRAMLPYVNGRYKLIVDDGGNATDITSATVTVAYDVDNDTLTGPITLQGETKGSKYNQVIVNYIEPSLNFTNQQVIHKVDADKTADNDEELTGEFTFPTLTNKAIAREMARMIYDKSRSQRAITFTATPQLIDIIPGDIIRVTDSILNLNLTAFRVIASKITKEMNVEIEAVEHFANAYPFVTGPQIEVPPQLFLPSEPSPKPIPTPPPPQFGLPGLFPPVPFPPDFPDDGQPGPIIPPGGPYVGEISNYNQPTATLGWFAPTREVPYVSAGQRFRVDSTAVTDVYGSYYGSRTSEYNSRSCVFAQNNETKYTETVGRPTALSFVAHEIAIRSKGTVHNVSVPGRTSVFGAKDFPSGTIKMDMCVSHPSDHAKKYHFDYFYQGNLIKRDQINWHAEAFLQDTGRLSALSQGPNKGSTEGWFLSSTGLPKNDYLSRGGFVFPIYYHPSISIDVYAVYIDDEERRRIVSDFSVWDTEYWSSGDAQPLNFKYQFGGRIYPADDDFRAWVYYWGKTAYDYHNRSDYAWNGSQRFGGELGLI